MMFIFFIVSYLFCGCKGTKIIRNQKYHDCGILQKKSSSDSIIKPPQYRN